MTDFITAQQSRCIAMIAIATIAINFIVKSNFRYRFGSVQCSHNSRPCTYIRGHCFASSIAISNFNTKVFRIFDRAMTCCRPQCYVSAILGAVALAALLSVSIYYVAMSFGPRSCTNDIDTIIRSDFHRRPWYACANACESL